MQKFGQFQHFPLLCHRMAACRPFTAVPWHRGLLVKIEALCSFLQGENVGNFQSLQKSFEEGSCATLATLESKEDLHISFTLVRGTEHDNTSYFDSGTSYDPRLEDADIQFHASFVSSFNVFTGLGGHMKNYYGTENNC